MLLNICSVWPPLLLSDAMSFSMNAFFMSSDFSAGLFSGALCSLEMLAETEVNAFVEDAAGGTVG